MHRLDGKVIMVTGAGAGLGRASATMFAAEGARVAIAEIDPARGEETAHVITRAGGDAIYVKIDVGDPESVENAVSSIIGAYGRLTTLHNNAGGASPSDNTVVDVPIEEFWRTIKLNLFGTFLCSRFCIPEIIKAGGGSVINMSSSAGLMGIPTIDCYTASKGGVNALTRSMAVEFAPYKVRVNAIAPGLILTERTRKLADIKTVNKDAGSKQALGIGDPNDIAAAAVYLASDESKFTTGAIFPIDGGMTSLQSR